MIAKIIILVIFVLLEGYQVRSLRCYVCSDDEGNPCTNFESNKHEFIQECKPSDKGCFREKNGGKKTRSCNPQGIDDCKTANEVEYCFCSTDLCNGYGGKFLNPTDDEDLLIEGSGIKLIPPISKEKELVKPSSANRLSKDICLYFTLILFFTIMY